MSRRSCGIHKLSGAALYQIESGPRLPVDTMGASNHVIGLRGGRLRIGVLDGVFGRSHTPTGEKGEAAANGNAIYRGDAGLALCYESYLYPRTYSFLHPRDPV